MPNRKNRVRSFVVSSLAVVLLAASGGEGGSAAANTAEDSATTDAADTVSGNGSVTLTWHPPTENIDGSPLSDLSGYRVYWGTLEGDYPHSATLDNPGLASYVVEQLAPAQWFFVMTALTTAGAESEF